MQYLVEVRASAIGYYEVEAANEDEAKEMGIRAMDIDTISELYNFEIHSVERV